MDLVTVNRVDKSINLPKYATDGSVGIDMIVRQDTVVPCNKYFENNTKLIAQMFDFINYMQKGEPIEPEKIKQCQADILNLDASAGLKRTMIPLNLEVDYPKGKWGILVARGGLYKEKGIIMSNGFGTIDKDFVKEHWFPAINLSGKDVLIKAGEAIAQLIFLSYEQVRLLEGHVQKHENHNGESSTGGYATGGVVNVETMKQALLIP